jgi:hypothetical protein
MDTTKRRTSRRMRSSAFCLPVHATRPRARPNCGGNITGTFARRVGPRGRGAASPAPRRSHTGLAACVLLAPAHDVAPSTRAASARTRLTPPAPSDGTARRARHSRRCSSPRGRASLRTQREPRQRPPHQLLEGRTLTFHLAAEPRTTRPRGQGTALTSAAGRLAGRSSSTRETRGRTSPRTLVSRESRRVLGRRRSTPVWQIRRGRGGRRASRRGATSRVDSIFHTAAITV